MITSMFCSCTTGEHFKVKSYSEVSNVMGSLKNLYGFYEVPLGVL